ncbi:hypothetical protein BC831DRAFT_278809 [Entophlyctis helioformis]|nr:hypothetical protein BC831DRAFT_278809 [Entophlyctis helioformis]
MCSHWCRRRPPCSAVPCGCCCQKISVIWFSSVCPAASGMPLCHRATQTRLTAIFLLRSHIASSQALPRRSACPSRCQQRHWPSRSASHSSHGCHILSTNAFANAHDSVPHSRPPRSSAVSVIPPLSHGLPTTSVTKPSPHAPAHHATIPCLVRPDRHAVSRAGRLIGSWPASATFAQTTVSCPQCPVK